MYRKEKRNFDNCYITRYDPEYSSLVSRTCKCGHVIQIYNRHRREICKWCGRMVFLSKKEEFKYNMKRKGVI